MGDISKERASKLLNDFQDISFVSIALIVLGAWLIIYLSRRLLPYLAERGPSQFRLYLIGAVPVIRLLTLTVAIIWIFPIIFNITMQNFLVIAGAASVAIGFAFKDLASSVIAGVVAVFERPYRPGDWVRIDKDYGEVISVGLRSLQLRTPADDIVTVPHDRIWEDNIINSNDGSHTLMCVADFYVAPGNDAARLRAGLDRVAATSAFLHYDRPIIVIVTERPFATHFKLKAYPFDMRDQFLFISDLTVRGQIAIAAAGAHAVAAPVSIPEDRGG